tara:strand:+ start:863 stop:1252 length:390 start_codon:yes stop_codon:yes gene_type:complete
MSQLFCLFLLSAFISSCSKDHPYVESMSENNSTIAGVWTTEGEDKDYGHVVVEMRLMDSGGLKMILFTESGSQRSFPGSWLIEENELVLKGRYFGSQGEERVVWKLIDEDVLILRDEFGSEQKWFRALY